MYAPLVNRENPVKVVTPLFFIATRFGKPLFIILYFPVLLFHYSFIKFLTLPLIKWFWLLQIIMACSPII